MRQIKAAAIQMKCDLEHKKNLQKAEQMIRKAAAEGANIILLPELFEREYFCQQRRYDFYSYARTVEESEAVAMGVRLAKELGVVLPISFYERDVNNLYNSIACIDGDGTILGVYRKPTSRMIIIIRKNFILHREIPDLKCLIQNTVASVLESAGISGSRRQRARWRCSVQNYCFTRQRSARNRF